MIALKRTPQTDREKREAYELVTLRDDGECQRCHRCGPFQRHHRQRRDDFNTRASNLLGLGLPCHKWVTEHPAEAMKQGLIVSVYSDPREVPVLLWKRIDGLIWRRTWALLDDDGGVTWIGPKEARERMSAIGVEAAAVA